MTARTESARAAQNERSEVEREEGGVPVAVLERDEGAWRTFVAHYDGPLRSVVGQATEATHPLSDDQIDDVMGDFWLAVVAHDMRLLRTFNPAHGSSLLTWLTFHIAHIANSYLLRLQAEPSMVPLDEALHVPAPRPRPVSRKSTQRRQSRLPSGRQYSADELALLEDFATFLVKLGRDGKLDEPMVGSDGGQEQD